MDDCPTARPFAPLPAAVAALVVALLLSCGPDVARLAAPGPLADSLAPPVAALAGGSFVAVGGSFQMPAGGEQVASVPLGPTGIVIGGAVPVNVVIGGAITRQATAGLKEMCTVERFVELCATIWADLVAETPIPPAGLRGVFARAFASWAGAEPGPMGGDAELSLSGPSGGELWAGRAGWECYYSYRMPDEPQRRTGPCHTFGGGYVVTVQPEDGDGALSVSASPSRLPAGGGSVTFRVSASGGAEPTDIGWQWVADIGGPGGASVAGAASGLADGVGTTGGTERPIPDGAAVLVPGPGGRLVLGRGDEDGILLVRRRASRAPAPLLGGAAAHAVSPSVLGRSSATGCAGQATCTQAVSQTGSMLVRATLEGTVLSAAARVEVGGGGGGGTPAPPQVRLTVASEEIVAPRGLGTDFVRIEVSVVDSTGAPLPNRAVGLMVGPQDGTAGHAHAGGKPAGDFDGEAQVMVVTGSDGLAYAVYRAPLPAGTVEVRGSSDGATDAAVTILVGIGGLVELPEGGGVVRIGVTAIHPQSHWGTPGMIAALQALGGQFHDRYSQPIEVNDTSLPLGGVFDLSGDWEPPHSEHRVGTSADVRTRGHTEAELRFIQRRWEAAGGSVHDETRTEAPHYHLRF